MVILMVDDGIPGAIATIVKRHKEDGHEPKIQYIYTYSNVNSQLEKSAKEHEGGLYFSHSLEMLARDLQHFRDNIFGKNIQLANGISAGIAMGALYKFGSTAIDEISGKGSRSTPQDFKFVELVPSDEWVRLHELMALPAKELQKIVVSS